MALRAWQKERCATRSFHSSKFFHRRVASAIIVKSLFGGVIGKRKPLGCHFALDDLKIFISRSLDNFQKMPSITCVFYLHRLTIPPLITSRCLLIASSHDHLLFDFIHVDVRFYTVRSSLFVSLCCKITLSEKRVIRRVETWI